MGEPREMTVEECREIFMRQVASIAAYWARVPGRTDLEKCNGVAFSILSMLDGSNVDIPAFDLIPSPHGSDEEFHRDEGENWWPRAPDEVRETLPIINDTMLHEMWHRY
ncbi:MAG: hypothetical protein GF334_05760 [Candidatus Altiarchaeales archaeon]|nr:hypothetical protein [Candidatus Altiarchaeales archaeon]